MRVVILLLVLPAFASAQAPGQRLPIDQAVEDVDPLATSLRRVSDGLFVYGDHSRLFLNVGAGDNHRAATSDPDPKRYSRVGPGFHVQLDRPHYLVAVSADPREKIFGNNITPPVDGQFLELLPVDAVFDLGVAPPVSPIDPHALKSINSHRIDAAYRLVDARIDTRIDARVKNLLVPWSPGQSRRSPALQQANNAPTLPGFDRGVRLPAIDQRRAIHPKPISMLSISRTLETRAATSATTPVVRVGSMQPKGASVRR